jgi:hypothetical protein
VDIVFVGMVLVLYLATVALVRAVARLREQP